MQNYIQFFDNEGREMIASDGCIKFDGRLGLLSLVMLACSKFEKLKNIRPYILGFSIIKKGRVIYSDKKAFEGVKNV